MDDRNEEVFRQYDLKVTSIYRARGALLLDTDKGLILYGRSGSSNQRLEYENRIKLHLKKAGYEQIDLYLANKDNMLLTADSTGDTYTMRHWFQGEECNLRELGSTKKAAENLGRLHQLMKGFFVEEEINPAKIPRKGMLLNESFRKKNRELKRVRSYILEKKQKNEFEILFLKAFPRYYENALEAEALLEKSPYFSMTEEAKKQGIVFHGSYNQHNILFTKKGIATINFDKSDIGVQIVDLYQFMRKAMEKNNWNLHFGMEILDGYAKQSGFQKEQAEILYLLMLYPEKFWKITNFYYNNKKSWISARNIHKLANILEQEEQRRQFIKRLETYRWRKFESP